MTRADPVPGEPSEALPVLFLHIPRTGGSTLKFMLQAAFGLERSLLDTHLFRTADEDLRRFAFVEGHLRVGFLVRSFGVGWYTNGLTMLRDPVARTVSQARHIRAQPGRFQQQLLREVRDPDAVFEQVPRLINLQTKQLSRTPISDLTLDADALTIAKNNLDHLAFGLTEMFDTSIALFVERFGLEVPRFDAVNVSSGTNDADLQSERFRAAARAHNDIDSALYEHAAGLFATRVAAYTETLLGLPADDATLTCALRSRGRPVEDSLYLPSAEISARLSGWVLVDGHAPDAVLVRVGEQVTPLAPRVERDEAGRRTRDLHNRYAGVLGTIAVPADARFVELIAFDRTRKLRAQCSIEITRTASRVKMLLSRRKRPS